MTDSSFPVQEKKSTSLAVLNNECSLFLRSVFHQLIFKYGGLPNCQFRDGPSYEQLPLKLCTDPKITGHCEYNLHLIKKLLKSEKLSAVSLRFVDATNTPIFEVELRLLEYPSRTKCLTSWAPWGYRQYLRNQFSRVLSTICSLSLPGPLVEKLRSSDQRLIFTFLSPSGNSFVRAEELDRRLKLIEVNPFIYPRVLECGNGFELHSSQINFTARYSSNF